MNLADELVPLEGDEWPHLSEADMHLLNAATGWLLLGDEAEASAELSRLPWIVRDHPDVLILRCEIAERQCDWTGMATAAGKLASVVPEDGRGWDWRERALQHITLSECKT